MKIKTFNIPIPLSEYVVSHVIIESNEIEQASSSLGKSVLIPLVTFSSCV